MTDCRHQPSGWRRQQRTCFRCQGSRGRIRQTAVPRSACVSATRRGYSGAQCRAWIACAFASLFRRMLGFARAVSRLRSDGRVCHTHLLSRFPPFVQALTLRTGDGRTCWFAAWTARLSPGGLWPVSKNACRDVGTGAEHLAATYCALHRARLCNVVFQIPL